MRRLIVGTRGSKLAMYQTEHVASMLDCPVEIKIIQTRGYNIQDVPLANLDGKAFFTKEIDDALLKRDIDFAVHSFKDIPTLLPDGIVIGAVPERESSSDALVGPYATVEELPRGAIIGTSSLRRQSFILARRPDVVLKSLRGNVDTRVKKLKNGEYDAIIAAAAGMKRMGYSNYHELDPKIYNPAAGQGAIAVTARADDKEVLDIITKIDDPIARESCRLERLFLETIEGGCQIPAGVHTVLDNNHFEVYGFISTVDGQNYLSDSATGSLEDSEYLTTKLAMKLLDSGGREILSCIRQGGS